MARRCRRDGRRPRIAPLSPLSGVVPLAIYSKATLGSRLSASKQDRRPSDSLTDRAETMADLGLTHVAFSVRDLDASVAFYETYAQMSVVSSRLDEGSVRVAWLTDHTKPFIIVLIETPN